MTFKMIGETVEDAVDYRVVGDPIPDTRAEPGEESAAERVGGK